jgi:regulator of replication initiation timing
MSKFAIPNVDIPKLTNSDQQFQYLLNIVQELQQRVTSHDDVVAELTALRTENATLMAEITNLHAQLKSSTSRTTTEDAPDSSSVFPPLINAVKQTSAAPIPSYSAVAARSAPKPVTKKRKLAAGRTFIPVDPSAPRGFEYLYLNRNRKLTRAEVRRNLRLLGLDLFRVLDICFPGSKVIGLLVHVLYKGRSDLSVLYCLLYNG